MFGNVYIICTCIFKNTPTVRGITLNEQRGEWFRTPPWKLKLKRLQLILWFTSSPFLCTFRLPLTTQEDLNVNVFYYYRIIDKSDFSLKSYWNIVLVFYLMTLVLIIEIKRHGSREWGGSKCCFIHTANTVLKTVPNVYCKILVKLSVIYLFMHGKFDCDVSDSMCNRKEPTDQMVCGGSQVLQ